MRHDTFLEKVLPDTGNYCICAFKNKSKKQFFVNTINDITTQAKQYLKNGYDLYFALSSFKSDKNRKATNVLFTRSFFVDVDCGETKPYKTKRDGLSALKKFCADADLPIPSVVDSGNGYHAYWSMSEPLNRDKWVEIASMLKAACVKFSFNVDPAVTADSSRILRIPGTANLKDQSNPKEVKIMHTAPDVDMIDIIAPLQSLGMTVALPSKAPIRDKTTDALAGNIQHSFKSIVTKSLRGEGCAQIAHIIKDQSEIDEPLWRSGLSIAAFCKDWEVAIHKMSTGHADYDREDTIAKAKLIPKPHTCNTFRDLNPELCEKCKAKVKSPISIDRRLKPAEPKFEEPDGLFMGEQADKPKNEFKEEKKRRKLPNGYEFGANGGIYRKVMNEDGTYEPKLVYKYDIYPVERMNDPNDNQCVIVRVETPNDPTVEFSSPLAELLKLDKGTAILRGNGVIAIEPQYKEIINYMSLAVELLQKMRAAQTAHLQYGWTKNDKSFIVGHREYHPGGTIKRNFASSSTRDTVELFESMGSMDKWREAVDVYNDMSLKPHAFVFLAGFGSPLMKFTGQDGAVINLCSTASGTGKSTAGRAALSIWGDPRQLLLNYNDTRNSRVHRTGVMSNLPVVMDEMTNVTAEDVSNLLYGISSGRDRNRMQQHANIERANKSLWNLLVLTNSNASMMDKVGSLKSTPDGEAARMLEFQVVEKSIPGAAEKFALLDRNFGMAGDIYARWLVDHADELPGLVRAEMENIIKLAGATNKERYWVSGAAAVIAGGRIAFNLGLHGLNMKYIEEWVVDFFTAARDTIANHSLEYCDVINEFIIANSGSILTVNGDQLSGITGTKVHRAPASNTLRIRIEPENSKIWLNMTEFRAYCSKRQITMEAAIAAADGITSDFFYVGRANKRMFAGTGMNIPPLKVLEFDIRNGVDVGDIE